MDSNIGRIENPEKLTLREGDLALWIPDGYGTDDLNDLFNTHLYLSRVNQINHTDTTLTLSVPTNFDQEFTGLPIKNNGLKIAGSNGFVPDKLLVPNTKPPETLLPQNTQAYEQNSPVKYIL